MYMPHKRIDMLPARLSGNICSLHCQMDRLAVSVLWKIGVSHLDGSPVLPHENPLELQKAGNLVFSFENRPVYWAGRTIIHSLASMTYQQAQDLCDYGIVKGNDGCLGVPLGQAGAYVAPSLFEVLSQDIKWLVALGRDLKEKRMGGSQGGIDLELEAAQPQLRFRFDPNSSLPVQLEGSSHMEIHSTVAEMMILANSSVAEYIRRPAISRYEEGGSARPLARLEQLARASLIRVHPPPSIAKLRALEAFLRNSQVPIPENEGNDGELSPRELLSKVRTLREAIHAVDPATGERYLTSAQGDLVMSMTIRSMQEATYMPYGGGTDEDDDIRTHVGLGLKYYTHFTSPIRRYADVIVHRQLLEAISLRESLVDSKNDAFNFETVQSDNEQRSIETALDASPLEDEDDLLDALLEDVGNELLTESPLPPAQLINASKLIPSNLSSSGMEAVSTKGRGIREPLHRHTHRVASLCNSLNRARAVLGILQEIYSSCFFVCTLTQALTVPLVKYAKKKHKGVICSVRRDAVSIYLPALNLTSPLVLTSDSSYKKNEESISEVMDGLKVLQRVVVVVRGDGEVHAGLPDIVVSLASPEPATDVKQTRTRKNSSCHAVPSPTGPVDSPPAFASAFTHPVSALRESDSSSFPASVKYMHDNPRILPLPRCKTKVNKGPNDSEITHFTIAGTGRVYFAPSGSKEDSSPPPVFLANASKLVDNQRHANQPTHKTSSSGTIGSGSAAAVAVTGIEAARERMRAWGEEWG